MSDGPGILKWWLRLIEVENRVDTRYDALSVRFETLLDQYKQQLQAHARYEIDQARMMAEIRALQNAVIELQGLRYGPDIRPQAAVTSDDQSSRRDRVNPRIANYPPPAPAPLGRTVLGLGALRRRQDRGD